MNAPARAAAPCRQPHTQPHHLLLLAQNAVAHAGLLADETGRSYTAVHKLLTYAGTTFRPRGGVLRKESAS
ncbi:helix-turn-helix domain-containing protein [Streptomyces celluloflavus]|uniref:Helix-turn-helix domain-containing protein n=1 Tax=Streptomyces celluloflavus TaxID=58344 RepID=A0ABW7RK93_9ACTN